MHKYKNPRNLCSGSVRQLNSQITAERNVHFEAFALVKADGVDFHNSRKAQFEWLKGQGFEVVHYRRGGRVQTCLRRWKGLRRQWKETIFPLTGWCYCTMTLLTENPLDVQPSSRAIPLPLSGRMKSGRPPFHYIEWSASRTGLINPVAVFEPVELEGTTVSRASVHNTEHHGRAGAGSGRYRITVYKANMIIPQIEENLTRSGVKDITEGMSRMRRQDGNPAR